jgi:hypothetical protein
LSLLHREPRTLSRDSGRYRDDRLFLIACDDRYAPPQYFEFFEIPRVRIIVDPTLDSRSAPQHVLSRLLAKRDKMKLDVDDECWLVLDTDHNLQPSHRTNFAQTIQEAKAQGIKVAVSCPCFEIWLLLHHATETDAANLSSCDDIQNLIRSRAGSYNKTRLKREHYRDGSAAEAILRSERLDATVQGGDIPQSPTTRVHKLLRAIMAKGLPAQLPPELRP